MAVSMNECIVPVSLTSNEDTWIHQHSRHVHECKEAEPEVLLIGDSIVQKMIYSGNVWSEVSALHPLNLGIGGDRTQNVLWRILNGAMDQTHPRVILLHVGTNNHGNDAQQISEGILKIVDELQRIFSTAHIVVWGLLPRGESLNSAWRRNDEVNELLQKNLVGKPLVEMICTGDRIIPPDGFISDRDMYDSLNFTDQGYTKIFTPILEKLKEILNTAT